MAHLMFRPDMFFRFSPTIPILDIGEIAFVNLKQKKMFEWP